MNEAKKYSNIKLFLGIFDGILSFILLYLFVQLGFSRELDNFLSAYFENSYLRLIAFTAIFGTAFSLIFFPIGFYTGFILEHKYNLSNQSFLQWMWENFKGTLIGSFIGIPILLLFFWSINFFGNLWWLSFAIIMFLFSVVLAQIVPIVILPMFYKITPIDNKEIIERILKLSGKAGMKIENVYKFNMSKDTKKANAAFTGMGKTKRVLLGDTLLDNYSDNEIETVLAHEFGHYKHKHHLKQIIISTISSFVVFFILSYLYSNSVNWFGFKSITEIGALPILVLWGMIVGLIQTPISNILSRKFEYQADEYAIQTTKKAGDFIATLEKLTDQNLGDRNPHPLVEWFFYSHPSISKRTAFIKSLENKLEMI